MGSNLWSKYFMGLILTICYLILINGLDFLADYLVFNKSIIDEKYYFIVLTFVRLLILLIVWSTYKFLFKIDFGNKNSLSIKTLLLIVLLFISFRIVNDPVITFNYVFSTKEIPDVKPVNHELKYVLNFFLYGVILTPIAEEIVFRGIILTSILKKNTVIFSIALSSLFFSIIHLNFLNPIDSLVKIPHTFTLGLIAGYVYYRTMNLIYPIILHILYNSVALAYLLNKKTYWNMIKILDYGWIYWIIILSAVIIFYLLLKQFHAKTKIKR